MKTFNPHLLAGLICATLLACFCGERIAAAEAGGLERTYLSPPVRVTDGLVKAGEGYFSADARRICYQGVPAGYPFYQIYVQPFDARAPRIAVPQRVSTGRGRIVVRGRVAGSLLECGIFFGCGSTPPATLI